MKAFRLSAAGNAAVRKLSAVSFLPGNWRCASAKEGCLTNDHAQIMPNDWQKQGDDDLGPYWCWLLHWPKTINSLAQHCILYSLLLFIIRIVGRGCPSFRSFSRVGWSPLILNQNSFPILFPCLLFHKCWSSDSSQYILLLCNLPRLPGDTTWNSGCLEWSENTSDRMGFGNCIIGHVAGKKNPITGGEASTDIPRHKLPSSIVNIFTCSGLGWNTNGGNGLACVTVDHGFETQLVNTNCKSSWIR